LALVLIGELEISLIRTKPKGRQKIGTFLVPPKKRKDAYGFIKKELRKGHQAFVIFPLIEPSEKLQAKALLVEHKKLQEIHFPEFRVGFIHGRMKKEEKDAAMKLFRDGKMDMLLSTSVIEVGVDIPNATIMMIESAERFGLAQLHQFRGRVGRGKDKSYCLLFSESSSEGPLERLRTLEKLDDGFALAEADLKFRGPGQVYGTLQSGYLDQLKIASLDDRILTSAAKKHAEELLSRDPSLKKNPEIKKQLEIFESKVHLE
jgi:ATP-dependent DNA helicase RecG